MAALRSRDLHDRADWVERTLPELIETYDNESLLRKLGIDVASMPAHTKSVEKAGTSEDPHQ